MCRAVCQLKNKDGTVHRHGKRSNKCPGSDKAPLSIVDSQPIDSHSSAGRTSSTPVAGPSSPPTVGGSPSDLATDPPGQSPTAPQVVPTLLSILDEIGCAVPVIKHIPRTARHTCAFHLTELLRGVLSEPHNADRWHKLLLWPFLVLSTPKRGGKRNQVAITVKKRISAYAELDPLSLVSSADRSRRSPSCSLADAVTAKLEDGNISAAVRLICSDDVPAPLNEDTLGKLKTKHPSPQYDHCSLPDPAACLPTAMEESDVKTAIFSFPAGSSGGLDGLRPQHLKDMINCPAGGPELLSMLTQFVNLLLAGRCHPEVLPVFFGGRLIALNKKSGGIRPIAVGNTLRRLAAKCASVYALDQVATMLSPRQLGVGVAGGCEAAVHAVRRFVSGMQKGDVVVKLDFSNAFNSIHRDVVLKAVSDLVPGVYRFCHSAYFADSFLKFGKYTILSQEGVQQGDPLGPLLFCLAVHPILSSLISFLVAGYLDDFTLGGSVDSVSKDVDVIRTEGAKIGLDLNVSKCELVHHPGDLPATLPTCLSSFQGIRACDAVLLGAPLFAGHELDQAWSSRCDMLRRVLDRLKNIAAHDALILLRSCFGAPKVLHLLRCSPSFDCKVLPEFDDLLRTGLVDILNCAMSDAQWLQASLPVKDGGLGVRKVAVLAPSAYLASAASTLRLQDAILTPGDRRLTLDVYVDAASSTWSVVSSSAELPQPPCSFKQSQWDRPIIDCEVVRLRESYTDSLNLARLAAVSAPHSGDWLHALPITSCGLRLDDEAIRVSAGLRLGVNLCVQHTCPCGAAVDCTGIHGLSCHLAFGRQARHQLVNDIIWRAMSAAGVPSTKEPVGLLRDDGKRPDGLSLIPWSGGRAVTWDVTVVNPLAQSYLNQPGDEWIPGWAAEQAAARKEAKYSGLPSSLLFQPVAFECLGAINSSGLDFITDIGRLTAEITGEPRSTQFLFQRLSVAVQRFNSVAFRGTFSNSQSAIADDE